MTSKPPSAAASRRNSAQLTDTVDLTNQTEDTSERQPIWTASSSSPHSIPARVDLRNTPRRMDTARESGDADVDARIYVPDDASGVGSIRDGGGKGASTVDTDQDGTDEFRVLVSFDEQGGLVRLDAERID